MKQTKTYTASFHNGGRAKDTKDTKSRGKATKYQVCREHNIRDTHYTSKQKHIDPNGIHEIWHDETWQDAYERIFDEAFEKYNSKRRADRRTKSYLDEIKNSDQKVPVYESIVTIGNKDNLPDNPEVVKEIYKDFIAEWKKQNQNMEIIGTYYHADEDGAPHVHIDYIPVARNLTRGMSVQNSLTKALEQQEIKTIELEPKAILKKYGIHLNERKFKNPERQEQYDDFMKNRVDKNGKIIKTRLLTAQMQWEHKMRNLLIKIARKHGLKIENPNEHRAHFDTPEFKEQKSGELKEIAMNQIEELYFELEDMEQERIEQKEDALKEVRQQLADDIADAKANLEDAQRKNNEAEEKLNSVEKREKRLSKLMGIFHKLKTKLRNREKSVSIRETAANNRGAVLNNKLQELNTNIEKINEYRDQAVAFYEGAPTDVVKFAKELNLKTALDASRKNDPDKLMSWFKSVETKISSWFYTANYVVRNFFDKTPDEIFDSMRKNKAATFGQFVDMRMHGQTIEQISQKENLVKKGNALRKKIEDMSRS